MDIKTRNMILCICTVYVLIRITFPLPNFLTDIILLLLESMTINLKMSPNRIQFVKP
jgi:flagellar biosynthesis component FlhA